MFSAPSCCGGAEHVVSSHRPVARQQAGGPHCAASLPPVGHPIAPTSRPLPTTSLRTVELTLIVGRHVFSVLRGAFVGGGLLLHSGTIFNFWGHGQPVSRGSCTVLHSRQCRMRSPRSRALPANTHCPSSSLGLPWFRGGRQAASHCGLGWGWGFSDDG